MKSRSKGENRPSLSRRSFLSLCAMSAVGLTATSCIPRSFYSSSANETEDQSYATSLTGPDQEVIQLVYQDWRSDWFPGMVEDMLTIFHDEHPNIRVFFTPDPPDLEEKMLANMMAGTAPDLFQGCCTFFPIWAQKNYTTDLQPWVDTYLDEATVAEWDIAQYQALKLADGHRFGLPKYHGGLALFYNKELFDAANLTYPDGTWDYDQYLTAMQLLTQDRSGNGTTDLWGSMVDVSWDRIQVHVNGWGGQLIDPEDPTHCALADPNTLDAIEWLRARMWEDKVMATRLDVQNMATRSAFINQKTAMVEDGSWAVKDILTAAPFSFGVAPFPRGPERQVTLATTDGFGIYRGTHYPDEAWELMSFLISADYGLAMAQANFLQPAKSSLVDDWIKIIQQEFPDKIQETDLAAFAEGHRKGYSVTIETGPHMAEIQREADRAWEEILTLGNKPISYMDLVCQRIESL